MQKISSLVFFLVLVSTNLFAQAVLKNKKINNDEVPIVVASSFKKDFPTANGTWSVFYTQELNGANAVLTPKWYIFALNGDNKTVAQYSPSGKLERVKGMETAAANKAGTESSSKGNK